MLYEHEATVEVNGAFPVDMLRYDRCYPASEEDAKAIAQSLARPGREPCRVTVKALSPAAHAAAFPGSRSALPTS